MPRIITDQPASGKPLQLYIPTATNGGFVNTTWVTLAEAPDFSIPTSGDTGVELDPLDPSRELRPGEVFLETPLAVTNTDTVTRVVELQILLANGQEIPISGAVPVPAGETMYLPVQGQRLLKTNFSSPNGDRLRVRADAGGALVVFGSAAELGAQDHAPDTE